MGDLTSNSTPSPNAIALPPTYTYWGARAEEQGAAAVEPVAPFYAGTPYVETAQVETSYSEAPIAEVQHAEVPYSETPVVERVIEADRVEPKDISEGESFEPAAPEGVAEEVARGREVLSVSPASAAAHDLAERLETIARRLRTDGTAAVVAGMRGDRFDALLAGLFAGYLAAREED